MWYDAAPLANLTMLTLDCKVSCYFCLSVSIMFNTVLNHPSACQAACKYSCVSAAGVKWSTSSVTVKNEAT